jgi:phenylacetate-CoA ligase
MFALLGREKEQLPDGSHVAAYKDALYSDPKVADRLTGAFRITATETGFVIVHVQLVRGVESDLSFDTRVRDALGISPVHGHVVVSPYDAFPYGLTLDYERKFAYYTPGLSPVVA